ncbi:MAG: cytochrome P450 [Rubrobacteraceae bacterium]
MPDQKTKEPPYLRGNPLFGSALEMRRDPLRLLTDARRHGDFVRFRLGPYRVYLLSHPDYVEHVLLKNPRNYLKDGYEHIEIVGNGLLASEGDFWRRQRRIAQPAFHRERLAKMAGAMTAATETMLDRWEARSANEPLDVDAEMSRLTLGIVGRTLFSADVAEEADGVGAALASVLNLGFQRTGRFAPVPLGVPTPVNRRYRSSVRHLNSVVERLISARQTNGGGRGDLLDMLLEARDADTGAPMDKRQLRDEVMTILTAGYETTARALSWTLYLIDANPTVREKLEGELDTLNGRAPAFEDLERLVYTKMVVQESMRLYPPVWGLSRLVAERDEIGGYPVPKGSRIVISQYVTHRHPEFWENPEKFDPERFTPEKSAGRPRYAYFPFSGGPRQCIGNNFAVMEATLILATVAQHYRLTLVPGHPVEPEPSFTLRSRHGIRMVPVGR